MRRLLILAAAAVALAGCSDDGPAEIPGPFALTDEAIGRYCGMNVQEHPGPKGQIILGRIPEPIWFSSARDAVAFPCCRRNQGCRRNIRIGYGGCSRMGESWCGELDRRP